MPADIQKSAERKDNAATALFTGLLRGFFLRRTYPKKNSEVATKNKGYPITPKRFISDPLLSFMNYSKRQKKVVIAIRRRRSGNLFSKDEIASLRSQ
jgi:hypothetical protein